MVPKLLLAAIATIMSLALGEALVRVLRLAPPVKPIWISAQQRPDVVYKRSANPILGFELKPNYRNNNADQNSSYARTNAHGQRDVAREVQKPPNVRRIIMLGDSVVEGHGIADLDDTLSRQLEKLYPNGLTEVLNFGVSGYSTRAEVELLETKGLKFQPDVVVLVFVENDFNNFTQEAFQMGAVRDRPMFVKKLFMASHAFRLTCIRLNLFDFGVEADPVYWNRQAMGDNNVFEGLKRFRQLALEHGFRAILAVWPQFTDDGIEDLHPMPDGNGELIIENLANLFGIPTVRLSRWFNQDLKAQDDEVNPRLHYCASGDGLHPSRVGCHVAAAALKVIITDLDTGRYPMMEQVTPAAEGQALAAVVAARALGTNEPTYALVYGDIGLKHQQAGELDEAIRYYRLALEADPDRVGVMINLAIVLGKQGGFDAATKLFKAVLGQEPANHLACINYGNLLIAQGKYIEAEAQFVGALRHDPNMATVHKSLGMVYLLQQHLDRAVLHCTRAIELDPEDFGSHYNLAMAINAQGKPEAAVRLYEQALRLKPDFQDARKALERLQAELRGQPLQ